MTRIKPTVTDEMIEQAAQALHDHRAMECRALHEVGQPLRDTVYGNERRADARAALEAVAPLIAAQALEELRDYLAEDRRTWFGVMGVRVATDTSDPRTLTPLDEFLTARAAELRRVGR